MASQYFLSNYINFLWKSAKFAPKFNLNGTIEARMRHSHDKVIKAA